MPVQLSWLLKPSWLPVDALPWLPPKMPGCKSRNGRNDENELVLAEAAGGLLVAVSVPVAMPGTLWVWLSNCFLN